MKRPPAGPQAASQPSAEAAAPVDEPVAVPLDAFTVVGIGASAGGLEACIKFLHAVPAGVRMAFILIQHLDPVHKSLMASLLAGHTAMHVHEAVDGMQVRPGSCYVIPPGKYLSVAGGKLQVCLPNAPHGKRLPFDFLLHALAKAYGDRAACVVLSGTGADGSLGLKSIAEAGGLVIAEDPSSAAYDGMPRSAIHTGAVDLVLPVAAMPAALQRFQRRMALAGPAVDDEPPSDAPKDWLPDIVELLRTRTVHDFSLYKRGTIERRIVRRMAMSSIEADGMDRYLDLLKTNPEEVDKLAAAMLINVTSFFRDPKIFEYLANEILPGVVRNHPSGQPLRIWVAGCSTGEETYSLAMIFLEQIAAAGSTVRLQVFASDVDSEAITRAREGAYPSTIEAEVSAARLKRFFSHDAHSYRVSAELRAAVVFTVQDVLADPPFSRLDFVSCRNLLIYLLPEAQAKVVALFHFALREGGLLLLGNSETAGNSNGRFETIGRAERLYRHIGRSRPGEFSFLRDSIEGGRGPAPPLPGQAPSRQAAMAELGRRLVLERFAPAAVMINHTFDCLYSMGPTERYLRVAPGHPTFDLLAMARPGMRTRLRATVKQAIEQRARVVASGGRIRHDGVTVAFDLDIQPVVCGGDDLLLVCFVDQPRRRDGAAGPTRPRQRMSELEHELETTRAELQGAVRDLEAASEDQKAINEEAMSVSEEYQSTNEELLTSKEELQSLNEELTALNSQLQETLEKQRTTSDDLQNVLFSTDVATLFLDMHLNIRFFTPATRSLFNLIPGDVGRPLADLRSLTTDGELPPDAQSVLKTLEPMEREIETSAGAWFIRRILPYRSYADGVGGVVITFTDITERKRGRQALEKATLAAELANAAKSRFLAAASHDLRQPLQTLTLLQGLLAKIVDGARAQTLVARFDETLGAMTNMLNTLLDINQIEAGEVSPAMATFPLTSVLDRLAAEFAMHADGKGLAFRYVACGLPIVSDPALLEQILRNLLSNSVKYTRRGKMLLGCRRHDGLVRIEVWDTGVGIPADQLRSVFDEYHQVDNAARERSRGLGLGLSIVQRLADLLGHAVRVRSWHGAGSVFSIDVPMPRAMTAPAASPAAAITAAEPRRTGSILIVEDDPEVCDLLGDFLAALGHRVVKAPDGVTALDLVASGAIRPDLVLADYNLPNDMNGLEVAARLRERFGAALPVIILTGDVSSATMHDVAGQDCLKLNKPVKLPELTQAIDRLLPEHPAGRHNGADPAAAPSSVVFVVDDDARVREAIAGLLADDGRECVAYESCEAFLAAYRPAPGQCLLIDACLPGMDGMTLLATLRAAGHALPAIMMTGQSDVRVAVAAMRAGASDFVEKPIGSADLLARIERALEMGRDSGKLSAWHDEAAAQIAGLTARQREIMAMVLDGHPSKNIAADLGISQRTVENHRAAIMKKTGVSSLPALARLALAASNQQEQATA